MTWSPAVVEAVGVAELAVANVDEPVDVFHELGVELMRQDLDAAARFSAPLPPVWS